MKKIFLFLSSLAFLSLSAAEIPEPYRSVRDLPFDSGEGMLINQKQLLECLKSKKVMTVIEVGSWLGASTRFIASNLGQGAKLYAVDHWLGSADSEWMKQDHHTPFLYEIFLSNVKQAGLCHVIIPMRMSSLEGARAMNVMADLIYIDADHRAEEVYKDIMAWYPHLNKGGIMCGDDWRAGSVREGVQRAARELKREIYHLENFWKFY